MIHQTAFFSRGSRFLLIALAVFAGLVFKPAARAGLTVDIHTYRYPSYYVTYGWLSTNATGPAAPLGNYRISSPNGSFLSYLYDASGLHYVTGGGTATAGFNSYLNALTNGQWSIQVTNASFTNTYFFNVSATGLNPSLFNTPTITFPANEAQNVSDDPTFTWTGGPTGWQGMIQPLVHDLDSNYYEDGSLAPNATSWTTPNPPLPLGTNVFELKYLSNATAIIVASVPFDAGSNALSGWISTANLNVEADSVEFVVTGSANPFDAFLVARYNFENPALPGEDSSGNDNDNNCSSSSGPSDIASTDAAVGVWAREFLGNSSICFTDGGAAFPNLSNAISGNFTVTAWVKTTADVGLDTDEALWGNPVFHADGNGANYAHPLSITGSKAAFTVYDDNDVPTTVHSISTVNDGDYHFIAVTRNLTNGLMSMYVDGILEDTETGTTEPLEPATYFDLGGGNSYYEGLLDDVRIYSIALTANEVAVLAGNEPSSGGHALQAHYTFEDNQIRATDFSGNGNHVASLGSSGTGGTRYITNNPAFGTRAAYFDNNGGAGAGFLIGTNSLFPTLAGSFTISLWVQTTQTSGTDTDGGFSTAGLVSTFSGGGNSVRPMVLTGRKLGFQTGGSPAGTLHSTASITNHSQFVHLVVTRNQISGEKKIYVNGALDSSSMGSTASFDLTTLFIGWNGGPGFKGVMDEIQIYSGVLSAAEVASLYANPGSTVPDTGGGGNLAEAVDAPQFTWSTGGDANWFGQTSETHDTVDAARSGAIGDDAESWIETTFSGAGTFTFWWRVSSDDDVSYDYLQLDVDGEVDYDGIAGDSGWDEYVINFGPGNHTVRWTYIKDSSDIANLDAAFLDEVSFTPAPTPFINITRHPFSQTNSPGYQVGLLAGATSNAAITWQWYKTGSGLISGATNTLYIPTNSGTANVAGSYFAIASSTSGSATTTVASVTFTNATLPAEWSTVFKSPFSGSTAGSIGNMNQGDYYLACVADGTTNIYAAGQFYGGHFINGTNELRTVNPGACLVKHTTTGGTLWAAGVTNNGNGQAYATAVSLTPDGGVFVVGNFTGTNWLGTNLLISAGNTNSGSDIFVARYTAAGSNVWVKTISSTNNDFVILNTTATDAAGHLVIAGLVSAGANYAGTNIASSGQVSFLARFDGISGSPQWVQIVTNCFNLTVTAGDQRVYAIGQNLAPDNTITLGGQSITTDRRWVLGALNSTNGQSIWLRGLAAHRDANNPLPLSDDVPHLGISGTNLLLVGTAYSNTATFGAITVNFPTNRAQYFARYDTDGNAHAATRLGSEFTSILSLVSDAGGNSYCAGHFENYSDFGGHVLAGYPRGRTIATASYFSHGFIAKLDLNGTAQWIRPGIATASYLGYNNANYANFSGITRTSDGRIWGAGLMWGQVNFNTNLLTGDIEIISMQAFPVRTAFMAAVSETSAAPPQPITLINPQQNGANFQFQFQSQSGFNHAVQYRTNLVTGLTWQTYSNVTGDGGLKTIAVPQSIFSPAQEGFIRVATQ